MVGTWEDSIPISFLEKDHADKEDGERSRHLGVEVESRANNAVPLRPQRQLTNLR
jgi:hypothetical protein